MLVAVYVANKWWWYGHGSGSELRQCALQAVTRMINTLCLHAACKLPVTPRAPAATLFLPCWCDRWHLLRVWPTVRIPGCRTTAMSSLHGSCGSFKIHWQCDTLSVFHNAGQWCQYAGVTD